MKWIQLVLFSLLLAWLQLFMKMPAATEHRIHTSKGEWLVRFDSEKNPTTIHWPEQISTVSVHQPLHAVVIQTSLSDAELIRTLQSIDGVVRLEKAHRDEFNSPVYPTGLALIEPGANALPFLQEAFSIQPIQRLDALGWFIVEIPTGYSFEAFNKRCMQSGCIQQVHRDEIIACQSHQTNDPMFNSSWHIQQANDIDIDAPEAWNLIPTSAPMRSIAIIEGVGFDTLNVDLAGRFIDRYNAVDNSTNVYSNVTAERHGTATSGIPGAIANNAISAAGLGYNKLKLQVIRLGYNITSTGNFTTTSVMQAAAVNRAIAQSSTVAISMSFSSSSYQSAFFNAITSARLQGRANKGIPVFASTGNSGLNTWTNYPASYSGVIAVGATTSSDGRASFSNYGPGITLSAPGSSIATTDITGAEGYSTGDNAYFSGTSAACPLAASVGALMLVANDQLTETQVKQFLAQSCQKVGGFSYTTNTSNPYSTWSSELGYGRVNMRAAIELSLSQSPVIPDITLSGTTVSAASPAVGQTITIYATQQINPATGSAVFPVLEYRYSNDAVWSSDDIIIGTDASTLGSGVATESESITYMIPAGSGTKYILLRADAQSAVNESSEANNTTVLTITLPVSAALPDITLSGASVSATSVVVGQSITISCTQNTTSAGTILSPSLQYRLSTDAVWQTTDTFIGSDISTFSSTVLSEAENITYTIPNSIGTQYILLKADADNGVTESNENNNVVVIPITISAAPPLPDIYISNITTSASTAASGQSIVLSCRQGITNPGTASYSVSMKFNWSTDAVLTSDDVLLGTATSALSSLTLYEPESITFSIPSVPTGTYYVLLQADAGNTVNESNESNVYVQAISVTGTQTLPDIGISNATTTSTSAIEGSSMTVSCLQYTSMPSMPLTDVLMQYRWGNSPTYSPTMQLLGIDYSSLGGGDADDPEDLIFTVPAGSGVRYLFVIADVSNVISESNENNNIAVIPITVVAASPEWNDTNRQTRAEEHIEDLSPIVYPNPAHNRIWIQPNGIEWQSMRILNAEGRMVKELIAVNTGYQAQMDVSDLPAGLYIVQFKTGGSLSSCRLLLE
jgi:Subtilase family/Secretion system C-terminal sorting domain/CARDB